MKVIIEGRVHTHHTIIRSLDALQKQELHAEAADPVAIDVRQQLLDQNDAAECEMFAATVVGSPDEDLAPGMVLIDFGPVAVEVNAEELTRALRPFVE